MKIKGKYSESAILYAIILSCAAVVSIVVFFVVLNISGGKVPEIAIPEQVSDVVSEMRDAGNETQPAEDDSAADDTTEGSGDYEVSSELAKEMQDAVIELISDNYKVLRLYYTKGLTHKDEPYGNRPEDGYYSTDSTKYTSLEEIEAIVDRTYIPEVAAQIKENSLGYGPVFKTRDNGDLGIIADFTPMEYTRSWEGSQFVVHPISETECGMSINITDKADNSPVTVDAVMVKTDEGWRLTGVIF